MTFNINFQYELEQLGIMVDVEATYSNGGGGGDEPEYGPECEDISATLCTDDGMAADDIWDGLADLYTTIMSRKWVWVQGDNWWHIEDAHSGLRADMSTLTILPRKVSPKPWELDAQGQQRVYQLVSLQAIIQEMADEKAGEAEADGAGGPDPDEAHDRLQDEGL